MSAVGRQPELALEDRRSPGGVHYPAGAQAAFPVELVEGDAVIRLAEVYVLDPRALLDVHTQRAGAGGELVLEQTPI
jgi:hypothetical protein